MTYKIDRAKKLIPPKDVERSKKVDGFKALVDAVREALDGSEFEIGEFVDDDRKGLGEVRISSRHRSLLLFFGADERLHLNDRDGANVGGQFLRGLRFDPRFKQFVFDESLCHKIAPSRGWRRDAVVIVVDALKHLGSGSSLVDAAELRRALTT